MEITDDELGVTIKEDLEGRQGTFAVELTAFLPKPAHLMLLGSSAIGKTWLAKQTSAFIPTEHVQTLGSSEPQLSLGSTAAKRFTKHTL